MALHIRVEDIEREQARKLDLLKRVMVQQDKSQVHSVRPPGFDHGLILGQCYDCGRGVWSRVTNEFDYCTSCRPVTRKMRGFEYRGPS